MILPKILKWNMKKAELANVSFFIMMRKNIAMQYGGVNDGGIFKFIIAKYKYSKGNRR